MVFVYDERGTQLFVQTGELYGYTGSTLSVKRGSLVFTYNDRNALIATVPIFGK